MPAPSHPTWIDFLTHALSVYSSFNHIYPFFPASILEFSYRKPTIFMSYKGLKFKRILVYFENFAQNAHHVVSGIDTQCQINWYLYQIPGLWKDADPDTYIDWDQLKDPFQDPDLDQPSNQHQDLDQHQASDQEQDLDPDHDLLPTLNCVIFMPSYQIYWTKTGCWS